MVDICSYCPCVVCKGSVPHSGLWRSTSVIAQLHWLLVTDNALPRITTHQTCSLVCRFSVCTWAYSYSFQLQFTSQPRWLEQRGQPMWVQLLKDTQFSGTSLKVDDHPANSSNVMLQSSSGQRRPEHRSRNVGRILSTVQAGTRELWILHASASWEPSTSRLLKVHLLKRYNFQEGFGENGRPDLVRCGRGREEHPPTGIKGKLVVNGNLPPTPLIEGCIRTYVHTYIWSIISYRKSSTDNCVSTLAPAGHQGMYLSQPLYCDVTSPASNWPY